MIKKVGDERHLSAIVETTEEIDRLDNLAVQYVSSDNHFVSDWVRTGEDAIRAEHFSLKRHHAGRVNGRT
jgi:hypothetical protein